MMPQPAVKDETTIRRADFSDMEQLLKFGADFHKYAELGKHGLGYSRQGFSGVLVHFMSNPNCCVLVAELDGLLVGTIAGMVAPWFLDPAQLNASENWWYVAPEYRGTVGLDLLEEFCTWAASMGAKCMAMAGFAEKRLPALTRLYRLKGYKPLEMHFIKEL